MPQAIAFDCYRTLFDNSHDDWKKTFDEIIKAQNLPLNAEDFWTRWRKYEVNFRSIRTDLGRPFNSPPFKSYRQAWTECFEQVFKDIGVNAKYDILSFKYWFKSPEYDYWSIKIH